MKILPVLLFVYSLFLHFNYLHAQTEIRGRVLDEADQTALTNATIMLLQAKDSILVEHTRAGEDGQFKLLKKDTIPYLLIVSYPKYGRSEERRVGKECRSR